jgi:uncharacterized repeat protein (TIGR03943 family)
MARTVLLLSWAGLFWYLLLAGRWSLFLAERVQWIVPVAAVAFTLATLGSARFRGNAAVGRWGFALGIAPVLLVLIVPLGTLSSFAASRRTDFSAARFSSEPLEQGDELTFQRLAGAAATDGGRAALAQRQGERVSLVGLTMAPRADGFDLTRFVVSCCVVDASVVQVPVIGAPAGDEGSWVQVDGQLILDAQGKPAIQATVVTPAEQPDPPYLSPSAS